MGAKSLLVWLKEREPVVVVTPVTASNLADVTVKSPSLLACTPVTSVTSENNDMARQRIEAACVRLSLPSEPVLRQFDHWRYSDADLAEISDWDEATLEVHARLLLGETEEGWP